MGPRRKIDEIADALKAAALHYGSLALTDAGSAQDEAERRLKMAALAFYQVSRADEETRAIDTLLSLERGDAKPEPSPSSASEGSLGFADDEARNFAGHSLAAWSEFE